MKISLYIFDHGYLELRAAVFEGKMVLILRWSYFQGNLKVGFHCMLFIVYLSAALYNFKLCNQICNHADFQENWSVQSCFE